jgi:four helix bundle protein
MLNELAIFQKTYELIQYLYPLVNKFPKTQKFVLGQRIENSAVEVLEGIITANSVRDKSAALEKTSVELEKLRVFMRLAKDLRFMSFEQYEHASALINETGRMLGGWVKTQKT